MRKTILVIRIFFMVLCLIGAYLLWYAAGENEDSTKYSFRNYMLIGGLLGCLTILTDMLLKGFSLRGLTAVSFGIGMGLLISYMLSVSPLFEKGDEQTLFLSRLALFVVSTYLGTVITLRGKDEFNLVIPYVRFVPQKVDLPVAVVDASALIDGRLVDVSTAGFLTSEIIVPKFVLDELQRIAASSDPNRQRKGRAGLNNLARLRQVRNSRVIVQDSDLDKREQADAKLIYIAQSLNARILTTDYNLAKLAEFEGVEWLNINGLSDALKSDVEVGERLLVDLVKPGKDKGQAVGYLNDGSMVVVNNGEASLGKKVMVKSVSVLPSAGGKMIFAEIDSEGTSHRNGDIKH